jgi:hypothetical protein
MAWTLYYRVGAITGGESELKDKTFETKREALDAACDMIKNSHGKVLRIGNNGDVIAIEEIVEHCQGDVVL